MKLYLLIGAYSDGTTPGISVYTFDTTSGDYKYISESKEIINPSYLAVSPDEHFVYSVNETSDGSVSAFRFNKSSGELEFINSQLTQGADPCFITINKKQTFIVTANYSGGSISLFPLAANGRIGKLRHCFNMNDPVKKDPVSHIHTLAFSPNEKSLWVTDLGKDKIYRFNINRKGLKQNQSQTVDLPVGSGPRHLTFHPNGKYVYSINELSGTVSVFGYDRKINSLIQTVASDTTPGKGGKGSADIHISPDGKFLYASNRLKADGIAIFSIDPNDGKLIKVGYQETGIHPRNFILTPSGDFLLCANRDSNNIQVFKRNAETGMLIDTGKVIQADKPVCLKWIAL
jgi:6-phosphogluconolactonase (cycloisomerase 2 family)